MWRAYQGNGTGSVQSFDAETAIRHVLGQAEGGEGGSGADNISEFGALLGEFEGVHGTVDAIGINVGTNAEDLLGYVDDDTHADNIQSGDQLLEVLSDLTQVNSMAEVGADSVVGGSGNDLIFGDSIYTDKLAEEHSIDMAPGSGWAVIEALVSDGFFDVPGKTVNQAIMDFLRDPGNQALYEFGRESLINGQGRGGGDDTLMGGAGNDTIFGQEGEDIIIGGKGDDIISGGSGSDTFIVTAGDVGDTDVITDFVATGTNQDVLDLSDLLESASFVGSTLDDAVDGGYISITSGGGNTTITVDLDGSAGAPQVDYTVVLQNTVLTQGDLSNNIVVD